MTWSDTFYNFHLTSNHNWENSRGEEASIYPFIFFLHLDLSKLLLLFSIPFREFSLVNLFMWSLLITKCLTFPSHENGFIFLSFLKNIFVEYRILSWKFLNKVFEKCFYHFIWASIISNEKDYIWMFFPKISNSFFSSLLISRLFSLFLVFCEVWLWCVLVLISFSLSCLKFNQIYVFLFCFVFLYRYRSLPNLGSFQT